MHTDMLILALDLALEHQISLEKAYVDTTVA